MRTIKKDGYEIILSDSVTDVSSCVLALGHFDGIHIAHAALLDSAKHLRERVGATYVGVWCFEQNPLEFFSAAPPKRLLSKNDKIDLFLEQDIDFIVIADFAKFRDIPADSFINDHLANELGCIGAVCGFNFRFGQRREGQPSMLKAAFGEKSCVIVDKIQLDGVTVSSTKIREFISSGDMESANKFLGRPYFLNAPVTGGKKLGGSIGFPTANQRFHEKCIIPKHGIYATVCTTTDGVRHIGVSNVGIRPTITDGSDSHAVNCETYIIDFKGDIYGQNLKVEFYKLLREEKKFSSVEELRQAIDNDASSAVAFFESVEVAL